MYLKPVTPQDFHQIFSWYERRNLAHPPFELYPPRGFIVTGVAAGFLIKTDCNIAFLEHFISNPDRSKEHRADALDKIAERLIEACRVTGVIAIYALTDHPSIEGLTEKYGFKKAPDKKIWVKVR